MEATHSPPKRGITRIVLDEDDQGNSIPHQKTWGRFEVVCFSANYIVGTGFLTLPHAMVKAGLLLGILIVFFTALLANVAMECLLEAMARAIPLIEHRNKQTQILKPPSQEINNNKKNEFLYGAVILEAESEDDPVNLEADNKSSLASTDQKEDFSKLVIADERIELPALCELYFGDIGRTSYTAIISLYIVASLWSYAVLVAQTFSVALPLSDDPNDEAYIYSYWFYLFVFGVIATFLATLNLSGNIMVVVNLAFFVGRLTTVVLMLCTLLVAIIDRSSNDGDDGVFVPSAPAPLMDLSGVLIFLPISLFSIIFHHSVPTLSEPAIHKEQVGNYFTITIIIVITCYLMITVPSVIYFGVETKDCVALNWVSYNPSYNPTLAALLRIMVIFFPAFSLLSSYPLMCITLSNNIMSFGVPLSETAVRLLAAVPPLLFAALGTDLTTVAAIGGVLGFLISLIFPVLLQRASLAAMETQFGKGSADTVYSSFLTRSPFAVASVGALGLFLLTASSSQIVYSFAESIWKIPSRTDPEWG